MNNNKLTYEMAKFYCEYAKCQYTCDDADVCAAELAEISHEEGLQYLRAEGADEMIRIFRKMVVDRLQCELNFRMKYGTQFALEIVNDEETSDEMRANAAELLDNFAYWCTEYMRLKRIAEQEDNSLLCNQ